MMGKVTLTGPPLARVGVKFRYTGMAEECEPCEFKVICHSLEKGKTYRIVAVRDKDHPCALHTDDRAVVVEISEEPLEASVPTRRALEGALVTLEGPECPVSWCPNHFLCTRAYLANGQKVFVVSVGPELECPRGIRLRRAVVEKREG